MCAAGFEDGLIRVFSISTETLKRLKTPEEVMDMDKDQLDLENIQMPTGEKSKSLIGHSGSVFGISISPRRDFLVSGGEDGTVRLWSLLGWFQRLCGIIYARKSLFSKLFPIDPFEINMKSVSMYYCPSWSYVASLGCNFCSIWALFCIVWDGQDAPSVDNRQGKSRPSHVRS